ncbi:hypothetical protein Mp_7g12860 [Marchantia polymorpha subsp. ruderalis]|uniref:Uncharacterized protein n=2 Tax=Marchantia polymorpha TaxID=3197 RepID=A0AAF6BYY5_MARPO|nr:hypothetical protein MARPO_0003s0294 [Marchantia polymorpha]BBN17219.1 hypothetical protein Mp_7g12860 [Marchantia polymorpha subsp. ruderalis]|eukprot:PTQ49454.1 hypothetical protein MARPO_0003s0294 [Marchantia polymorpha]
MALCPMEFTSRAEIMSRLVVAPLEPVFPGRQHEGAGLAISAHLEAKRAAPLCPVDPSCSTPLLSGDDYFIPYPR